MKERKIPVSHKVIEKRRRDRINRCLTELGKTVPMALAKQSSGKLEKAEILEMTVQYLRALHAAEFPRGRDKELLAEFANYFRYGYHECMKNLVHYLTTVERMETKDSKYARIVAFLQSKARLAPEPLFSALPEPDLAYAGSSCASEPPGPFPWPGPACSPGGPYLPLQCGPGPQPGAGPFLAPVQGLERHYLNLLSHPHASPFSLHGGQHPALL